MARRAWARSAAPLANEETGREPAATRIRVEPGAWRDLSGMKQPPLIDDQPVRHRLDRRQLLETGIGAAGIALQLRRFRPRRGDEPSQIGLGNSFGPARALSEETGSEPHGPR